MLQLKQRAKLCALPTQVQCCGFQASARMTSVIYKRPTQKKSRVQPLGRAASCCCAAAARCGEGGEGGMAVVAAERRLGRHAGQSFMAAPQLPLSDQHALSQMTAPRHQHQRHLDPKFVLPSVAVGSDGQARAP
eukprot:618806-Pleurochrysis_carterae.AAC.3